MDRRRFVVGICTIGLPLIARAQAKLYRIGVVHRGGPYADTIDGLREGLKEFRLAEGKEYVLHVRAVPGDTKAIEAAAAALELEKVDVIYSVATSTTVAVKRATKVVPIVFYAGSDPVRAGLIPNFSKPGGRLTGIHSQFNDLTAKRLELLKALMPKLARAITFYNPENPVVASSLKLARDASKRLKVELVEYQVGNADELHAALGALKPAHGDALFTLSDALLVSQVPFVIQTARQKKMPIMAAEGSSVGAGALASYGVSYYSCGRRAAKYVQRVLGGTNPGDIPIEQIDTPHFAVNLKTAKALGLTPPEAVLARADQVIR